VAAFVEAWHGEVASDIAAFRPACVRCGRPSSEERRRAMTRPSLTSLAAVCASLLMARAVCPGASAASDASTARVGIDSVTSADVRRERRARGEGCH
jgi:hypothetical protein